MLDKLVQFFKNLFSGLFGGKKNDNTSKPPTADPISDPVVEKPHTPIGTRDLPPVEPDFPQDASEVEADTAATVVASNVEDPVVLLPGDDPAEPVAEPEPEVTKPVVAETPTVETPPATDTSTSHKARYLWCLDNGHGKLTAGKRSPKMANGKQLLEYEFNRDIVKRISEALDKIGVKYFNVVPEVEVGDFLAERVGRANSKQSSLPKIFLSIHANAIGDGDDWESPRGIETWHFHNSRTGKGLARIFQKHLIKQTNWVDRKIKSYPGRRQFYVLRNTTMPAVLTENGFYTNKEEATNLLKDSVRQKIADAHVDAILEIEKNGI